MTLLNIQVRPNKAANPHFPEPLIGFFYSSETINKVRSLVSRCTDTQVTVKRQIIITAKHQILATTKRK